MNSIMQQLVNQKINSLSKQELMQLAQQYHVPLNESQAAKVVNIIQSERIDVSNKAQVDKMIKRLQTEVDPHVSRVVNQLLQEFGHF